MLNAPNSERLEAADRKSFPRAAFAGKRLKALLQALFDWRHLAWHWALRFSLPWLPRTATRAAQLPAALICPSCARRIPPDALHGLCPVCVLEVALAEPLPLEPLPWRQAGDYELLQKIGEGTMGVVYQAIHSRDGTDAAIKFANLEALGCEQRRTWFLREAQTMSKLRHRNITRVLGSGCHEGRPYYAMELLDGGSLEDRRNRERYREPPRVAELMLKIARAVQFAHANGVEHFDLRPANILFDEDGEPHVSDFGLAQNIGGIATRRDAPPCDAAAAPCTPEPRESQFDASDIVRLGLLIHWLLRGELPKPANGGRPPVWVPTLAWSLEAIAHRALRRSATAPYDSVADLANDLERAAKHLPISEERQRLRRSIRWIDRHRLVTLLGVELVLLLLCIPFTIAAMLVELRPTLRELIKFSATAQAGAVMNELREAFAKVERMQQNPEVRDLVTWNDLDSASAALARHKGNFDNVSVFDQHGLLHARSPQCRYSSGRRNYEFRDSFQCAAGLGARNRSDGGASCIGRVYRSLQDSHLKLGIAAPLRNAEGAFIGVVLGSIDARESFGAIQMKCGRGECVSALIGPRDRDTSGAAVPKALAALAHPLLKPPLVPATEERRIAPASVVEICSKLDCEPDRSDPLGPARADAIVLDELEDPVTHQRSVAALAPVGKTGLIVVVARPQTALDASVESAGRVTALLVGVALSFGLLALGSVLGGPHLRQRYHLWRARRVGSMTHA